MTDRRIFRYKYAVHDANDVGDSEDRFDLVCDWDADQDWPEDMGQWDREMIAKAAAEDFHHNHDGWGREYPITLSIFRTDGTPLGTYEVDREVVPLFYARKVNG